MTGTMSDLTPQQLIDAIVRALNENWDRFAARNQRAWNERIVRDPATMQGRSTIRGTRITVELILRKLGGGLTPAEVIEEYPRLTESDIHAAQVYAADIIVDENSVTR